MRSQLQDSPVHPSELPCGSALQAGKWRAAGWQAWPVRVVPGRWWGPGDLCPARSSGWVSGSGLPVAAVC